MIMPKRMQEMKLKDELRRVGISPDTVDISALTDKTLSYGENYKNVMSQFKNTSNAQRKTKQSTMGIGNIDFKYAHQAHQARSPHSISMDEAIRNRNTYTEKQISRKPALLDRWYSDMGNSDIFGIDAFGSSKRRRR